MHFRRHGGLRLSVVGLFSVALIASCWTAFAQTAPNWTEAEKPIADKIKKLRSIEDAQRGPETQSIAHQIEALPAGAHKLMLAVGLAHLATEGDFGQATLQSVGDTLASAIAGAPPSGTVKDPADAYVTLAALARYEHVTTSMQDSPQWSAAQEQLASADRRRESANFTLPDVRGKSWTLADLRGKVVLVNFWATWCPPCRKEMPDLVALQQQFKKQGLVILGISDEQPAVVEAFLKVHNINYPILLDGSHKAADQFGLYGIPNSFLYDRAGKLAAEAIDMRTRHQFLAMLKQAGLE